MKTKQHLKQLIVTVFLSVLLIVPTFGAALGDSLVEPEDGWKRIPFDNSEYFSHDLNYYKTHITFLRTQESNSELKFKFKGTQLELSTC